MAYAVYKLEFKTGVHFGNGILSRSEIGFHADNLFSALYIEALKIGLAEQWYGCVRNGDILFSDAFPYIGAAYYVPKPMIYVEPKDRGDSSTKKAYKKIRYIPAEHMEDFLSGSIDPGICSIDRLGREDDQLQVAVSREGEDGEPYSVGAYYFGEGNGLYLIVRYAEESAVEIFEELMESLSYTGIGGKRSCGKGKFVIRKAGQAKAVINRMSNKTGRYMLLSSALPKDDELDAALEDASFLMQKRSGFVYSETFSRETEDKSFIKKKDLYTMQAGSCFRTSFDGDIYDVSNHKGSHPVYRYAKALFMEV